MKSRSFLLVLVLVLATLACNLPSNAATETPTLSIFTPSITQPFPTNAPTQTLLPSSIPPATSTGTPTVPVALPKEVAVNCRLGPGVGWIVLSGLSVGTSSQIAGKSGDGGWWYIVDPFNSGRKCWVASSVTNTAGNLAGIPVVEAPQATVTKVAVDVDPKSLSVAGCIGPILPLDIRWMWIRSRSVLPVVSDRFFPLTSAGPSKRMGPRRSNGISRLSKAVRCPRRRQTLTRSVHKMSLSLTPPRSLQEHTGSD
jgi:SH3 domain protein